MYLEMLAQGDAEFVEGINRSFPRFRSQRLDQVVAALAVAQTTLSAQNVLALLNALHAWRTQEPNEFRTRGGTRGVAYRLWKEAKQVLANRFHQNFNQMDPPLPPGCPGDTLLNIYVPEAEGQTEICHGFAYRWLIATGKLNESHPASGSPKRKQFSPNGSNMAPVLYPNGYVAYPAARVNGAVVLQPGDLIGMFVVPPNGAAQLGHSLIAETPTTWFSANNAGTFGVGTGRSRIDTQQFPKTIAGYQVGWVGNGNQWRRPDGVAVYVVYRR